jgi:hypothetical protein
LCYDAEQAFSDLRVIEHETTLQKTWTALLPAAHPFETKKNFRLQLRKQKSSSLMKKGGYGELHHLVLYKQKGRPVSRSMPGPV